MPLSDEKNYRRRYSKSYAQQQQEAYRRYQQANRSSGGYKWGNAYKAYRPATRTTFQYPSTAGPIQKEAPRGRRRRKHTAEQGDDFPTVANKYNVEVQSLIGANKGVGKVQAGQVLNVPDPVSQAIASGVGAVGAGAQYVVSAAQSLASQVPPWFRQNISMGGNAISPMSGVRTYEGPPVPSAAELAEEARRTPVYGEYGGYNQYVPATSSAFSGNRRFQEGLYGAITAGEEGYTIEGQSKRGAMADAARYTAQALYYGVAPSNMSVDMQGMLGLTKTEMELMGYEFINGHWVMSKEDDLSLPPPSDLLGGYDPYYGGGSGGGGSTGGGFRTAQELGRGFGVRPLQERRFDPGSFGLTRWRGV